MRGKVFELRRKNYVRGITPAYAGKSCVLCVVVVWQQDHPRLCGEKVELLETLDFPVGSPPPMRGKAALLSSKIPRTGITPAYAGKSHRQADCWSDIRDHPRLCGEKCEIGKYGDGILGSPPPMRGKVVLADGYSGLCGTTPAYAGKRQI